MADEAEDIGGISVSVGASHARLPADLAEADRIIEAWAKQPRLVSLGVAMPTQAQSTASARAMAQEQVRQMRAATAQAEAVTINGVRVGNLSNLQTSLQKAIGNVPVGADVHLATAKIDELRVETEKPITLNLPTQELEKELQTVLATLREITAETAKIAASPLAKAGGGGGGKRRKSVVSGGGGGGGGDEEGEEGGLARTSIRYVGKPFGIASVPLTPVEPPALTRQRLREMAIAARARQVVATPQLDEDALTRSNRVTSLGIGATDINDPNYRPDAGGAGVRVGNALGGAAGATPAQRRAQVRRDVLSDIAFTEQQANRAAIQRSARVRRFEIDEVAQARQVEARRAAITGSGRTSRTLASGLGALFGGTEQRQIEAQAAAQQATRQLASAERVIEPLDTRLRQLREGYNTTTGAQQKFYANQIKNIEGSKQYQDALTGVTKAVKDDAVAQTNLAKISSGGSVLRNLVAISAAGAGFGLALTAVDAAIKTVIPAIGDAIDQATGFGATSNKVTQALSQQTLAAHGNVNAVLAQTEAQAGLSTAVSDTLDSQIKLTTQVKAGAAAAGQAGGLYRAAIGANQQVPQGLLGGYGGIGGGALLGSQLGGGTGFAETIKSTFADFAGVTGAIQNQNIPRRAIGGKGGGVMVETGQPAPPLTEQQTSRIAQIAKDRAAAEAGLNDAAKRGAAAMGLSSSAVIKFGQITSQQATDLQNSNLPQELKDLAKSGEALYDSNGKLIRSYGDAIKGLEQAAVGQGIAPPEQIGRANLFAEQQRQREAAANLPAIQSQQAYERPSQIALLARQTQYHIGTQLPAQAALAAFANPNVPVGTGIAQSDQGKVAGQLKAAQGEQQQLNAYYKQGQDIIENTYRPAIVQNFGAAAGAAFDQALNAVKATGQQIASIQAGISNEQAAYQVAQYNYQLIIARRNLSDIGGLIGKNLGAGESELGVLERQNLALSRQGQQLQFTLSQRQINFQTALAGFQAPGITPEERQARVAEAKIEADFAQKQLNIQKQQFANQVKIVDIGNLRQGVDLVRNIGLLLQGRKVTIDTAAAEQRLLRLQQLQQQNVAKVTSYLSAVDNLASQAMGQIQQLEAAAGKALGNLAVTILRQYGITIKGINAYTKQGYLPAGNPNVGSQTDNNKNYTPKTFGASGLLGMTGGPTSLVVGEAQGEAVAILRNPRAVSGGFGGGTNVTIQFNGDIHTSSQADLAKITQAVVKALGRDASLKGLRGVG